MDSRHILNQTINDFRATLDQMARWGSEGFECSAETMATLDRWAKAGRQGRISDLGSAGKGDLAAVSGKNEPARRESLEQIRADLGDCRRCGLSAGRTNLVFGEGNAGARLVFVGEGPGFEEDRSGRPFVGPAGQLLTNIIQAMKLTREQVYICNVIKCRPPNNRDPLPQEIDSCQPFLLRQLSAINPEVVCTLGSHATRTLLNTTAPVSKLRGQFQVVGNLRIMPTFHPAYLLRNPDRKREVWEDMKKVMALLRIPL